MELQAVSGESGGSDARVRVAMSQDGSPVTASGSDGPNKWDKSKEIRAVALTWKDLTVVSRRNGRVLLDNVSGVIDGGFVAIMGPSGGGKTTLLNALACRLDRHAKVLLDAGAACLFRRRVPCIFVFVIFFIIIMATGEMRLNGQEYSQHELKKCAGYVMQDDVLNGHLTVEETLRYTAELRLPPTLPPQERADLIVDVMQQMGLYHVKDVIVGTALKKGISGGERKRLCVAMELITRPLLLFLDEPTSGLDSTTSLSLCVNLRQLADAGQCSVVSTIHQPAAKIFRLFHHLLLLKKGGMIVYQGPAMEAIDFFARTGFPVPQFTNPADHFLDVITHNEHESTEDLRSKEERLARAYQAREIDLNEGADRPLHLPREITPWTRQFATLFRRTLQEQWRKRRILMTMVLQAVVIAVLVGTAFLKIGSSQSSVGRRSSVLFFCVINQGTFGSMMMINSLPAERVLSLRERAAGTYYVSAYYTAKTLVELLVQVLMPIVFSCSVYFLVGFQVVAGKFFIFTAFMVLCSMAAMALTMCVAAIGRTTDMSVTILPMALEVCRLFGGFYLSPANLPNYFKWLDALSFVKYSYIGIALNELSGLDLSCTNNTAKIPDPNNPGNWICPLASDTPNGQAIISRLGLDEFTIPKCAGILISYITICHIFAFIALRVIKW